MGGRTTSAVHVAFLSPCDGCFQPFGRIMALRLWVHFLLATCFESSDLSMIQFSLGV